MSWSDVKIINPTVDVNFRIGLHCIPGVTCSVDLDLGQLMTRIYFDSFFREFYFCALTKIISPGNWLLASWIINFNTIFIDWYGRSVGRLLVLVQAWVGWRMHHRIPAGKRWMWSWKLGDDRGRVRKNHKHGDHAGLESRYNGGKDRRSRMLGRLPEGRNPGPCACKVMSWDSQVFPLLLLSIM